MIDRSRPHTIEGRYPYPAYLVQDGYWYHWETGELVGKVDIIDIDPISEPLLATT
jgi:hypothetical protein